MLIKARINAAGNSDQVQSCDRRRLPVSKIMVHLLKLAFAALIYYLLYRYNFFSFSTLKNIASDPWFLVLGSLAIFLTVPLGSLRWRQLLAAQGMEMGFLRVFGLFYLGFFANTLLPGAIGGDVVRAAAVCQERQGSRIPALSTILMDRVCGLYAIIFVGALSVMLLPKEAFEHPLLITLRFFLLALFAAATLSLAATFIFSPRLVEYGKTRQMDKKSYIVAKLFGLMVAISLFRLALSRLALGIVFSIVIQLLTVLTVFLACWIGSDSYLDYWACAFATSMAMFASIIPLTPGGMGIGEAAFTQLCVLLASSQSSQGFTDAFIAFRMLGLLVAMPGLLFYFVMNGKTNDQPTIVPADKNGDGATRSH